MGSGERLNSSVDTPCHHPRVVKVWSDRAVPEGFQAAVRQRHEACATSSPTVSGSCSEPAGDIGSSGPKSSAYMQPTRESLVAEACADDTAAVLCNTD